MGGFGECRNRPCEELEALQVIMPGLPGAPVAEGLLAEGVVESTCATARVLEVADNPQEQTGDVGAATGKLTEHSISACLGNRLGTISYTQLDVNALQPSTQGSLAPPELASEFHDRGASSEFTKQLQFVCAEG